MKLTELEQIGQERERLSDELAAVRGRVPSAVARARQAGATIAQITEALGISDQALRKQMKIPKRNG